MASLNLAMKINHYKHNWNRLCYIIFLVFELLSFYSIAHANEKPFSKANYAKFKRRRVSQMNHARIIQ